MVMRPVLGLLAIGCCAMPALAGDVPPADEAKVQAVITRMFAAAPPEWQARTVLDDTQRDCTAAHSQPSAEAARAIEARETAKLVFPADGSLIGDWKKGYEIANNGRGGQFSDPPGTVAGGNCFACHQLDPKELSYGTIGPSLTGYGRGRFGNVEAVKAAYAKIYDSQSVVACSNMPRFGVMKVLSEEQIKDVLGYLLDPASPVNK
jgi:L-cysteine S-thiosulfotransferase